MTDNGTTMPMYAVPGVAASAPQPAPVLQSVPQPQPTTDQFTRFALDAIRSQGPEAAADHIASQHRRIVSGATVARQTAETEAAQLSADARQKMEMFSQIHEAYAQETWITARQAAEISMLRTCVEMIAKTIASAEQPGGPGSVPVADLRAALATEPAPPVYTPTIAAFQSSHAWRSGQFDAPGGVSVWYPFVGWSTINYGPGAALKVEPTFFVENRALPLSIIEAERGVSFRQLLPMLVPAGPRAA